MIYIVVRRQNRCQISQLSALIKAKRERKLAFTAFLLLIAVFICSVPILVVMTSASYSPVFRTYWALRWVYIVVQINSFANPFLYFYRNKRYRKALLQIIGFEKTQEIERIDLKGHCARRNRCTVEPSYGHRRSSRLQTITLTSRADSWTEEHESVESHNDGKKNVGSMFDKNRQLAKRNTTLLARWYDADRK